MGGKLTQKQRMFALAYAGESKGNGTEAARLAGYSGNANTLKQVAAENLTKPYITAFIAELRKDAEKKASDKILSATEVLVGLTRIALADPAKVFEADGSFDLQKAEERGVSRLIKSFSVDPKTNKVIKVELHNAHSALVDLGKYHKLFTERIELVKPGDAARIALVELRQKFPELTLDQIKTMVAEDFHVEVDQISDAIS